MSKLIYFFRGTDIRKNVIEMSHKMEELYKKHFPIPIEVMRLPVVLGGMGMLFVDDVRQISRISYLVETKRAQLPSSLKEYIKNRDNGKPITQKLITRAYYRKCREFCVNKLRKNKTIK